jgi:hypothetical protein
MFRTNAQLEETMSKHCIVCKRPGALWLLSVDKDGSQPVHRPCGERTAAIAPEGVIVRVGPSSELRQQWAREKSERDARSFWAEKFQKAEPASACKRTQKPELALADSS